MFIINKRYYNNAQKHARMHDSPSLTSLPNKYVMIINLIVQNVQNSYTNIFTALNYVQNTYNKENN